MVAGVLETALAGSRPGRAGHGRLADSVVYRSRPAARDRSRKKRYAGQRPVADLASP